MYVPCPVCTNATCIKKPVEHRSDGILFNCCPRCGSFVLHGAALNYLQQQIVANRIDRSVLSHHLQRGQRPDGSPVELFEDDLNAYIDDHSLPSPQEQLNNLILLIGKAQPDPASYAEFTIEKIAACIGVAIDTKQTNEPNFSWLWSQILKQELFERLPKQGGGMFPLRLTMSGWELFEKLRHKTEDSYTAFMAMAFNQQDIAQMLTGHFKPAVARAGFELKPLNEDQPAGLIDNQIRAAIRSAAFVVADLTHANNGAYFEAGFAEGLGVPVLYTCQEDVFNEKKTHFDTNHMLTIPWNLDRPDDAAKKLTATIRATLPTKAKRFD